MPETQKGNKPAYRSLNILERDMLFAFYEKHNGNIEAMIRDIECPFRSRQQLYHYRDFHHFKEQLTHFRTENAKEITGKLHEGKIAAIEVAMKMLRPRQEILFDKFGGVVRDEDGAPKTIEHIPDHKELETAYKIIKTEMGEPASVTNTQHSGLKGKPIELVETNQIVFKDFNAADSEH